MTSVNPAETRLEAYAVAIRGALAVPKQADVYRHAIEAGYLTALADGDADAAEMAAIVRSLHALSAGLVVDWEVESVLDQCNEAIGGEGPAARCEVVGQKLLELGQIEAGMFIAALVALASNGIDKREAARLEAIGKAGGLDKAQLTDIVKRARALSAATK